VIHDSLVALRREEAQRDPEDDGEEPRGDGELYGRGESLPELRRDRLARRRTVPELEGRELPGVLLVLDVDRLVEAVLVLDRCDSLGSRPLAQERGCGAAGERPDPEEDEKGDPDEDRD